MGVDLARLLERARRWPMRAASRMAIRGSSSAGRSVRAGATGATRSASSRPGRFRALGRAAARGVDRQARQGPDPGTRRAADGPDRQAQEVRVSDEYELGQEFFRWEFATAVAGSILEINPFDQPDVQSAKDRTKEILSSGQEPLVEPSARGRALRAGEAGRLRLHPGLRRPDCGDEAQLARSRIVRARRRVASSRTGSAPATCTRRVSCTRAARRPVSSCRSSTTPVTSSRSPGSRSVSRS